jgi:BMFP domain-containing protein YqiC
MTDPNRITDDLSRFLTDAMGMAQGVQREAKTIAKTQLERFLREMDLVTREEFDVVKDMLSLMREQNQKLSARLATLEGRTGESDDSDSSPSPPHQQQHG